MDSVFVFLGVAIALGLIVMAARHKRTRISLSGEESALPDADGEVSGSLLTSILDGSSSHHACDSGSHASSADCGSHGGFDGGVHH